jgi:hypothetical protein
MSLGRGVTINLPVVLVHIQVQKRGTGVLIAKKPKDEDILKLPNAEMDAAAVADMDDR